MTWLIAAYFAAPLLAIAGWWTFTADSTDRRDRRWARRHRI